MVSRMETFSSLWWQVGGWSGQSVDCLTVCQSAGPAAVKKACWATGKSRHSAAPGAGEQETGGGRGHGQWSVGA